MRQRQCQPQKTNKISLHILLFLLLITSSQVSLQLHYKPVETMGSQQSYGHNPTTHSKQLQSNQQYQIYQSQSSEEYEKYQVYHDGSQDFEKNYQFRVENKHNDLVDVVFAGPTYGFIGCADLGKYEVITERIPQRLGDMRAIDSKLALVILKTALRGFRDLYRKHGIFGIKDSMIGINKRNKIKVWINHNFAVNRAEETPGSYLELTAKDQEREMVQNIIDLVDLRAEHGQLWREMIHLKEMRNPCTFDEALNLVDYFCGANQLNLMDQVNNGGNKRQKKVENAVQPHLTSINRNVVEETSFRVNGGIPVQHFPAPLPPTRETMHNNITFQSQFRPASIINNQVANSNIIPSRPPNTYFAFTAPNQQPIQVPVAQPERNRIAFMPQPVTHHPFPQNHQKMTQQNAIFQETENIITKETERKIESHVTTFAELPTIQKAENQSIGIQTFSKVNQQIPASSQNMYLKQPQIQVNINQIASQQSSSYYSPSVLNSNELDTHQLNYPEHKIVFLLEKTQQPNNPPQSSPFKLQHSDIAKEANKIQPTPSSSNKKEISSTPQRDSISYKEMRRLLLQELSS